MFAMHKVANSAGISREPASYLDIITRKGTGAAVTTPTSPGINLAGNGGLILTKNYSGTNSWSIVDTVRGISSDLDVSSTAAATTQSTGITAVSSAGYSTGTLAERNGNVLDLVDYVMRQGPGFLQIIQRSEVGYASNIPHNLGIRPGFILAKSTTLAHDWCGWHRSADPYDVSAGSTGFSVNSTSAPRYVGYSDMTSSVFSSEILSWDGSTETYAYNGGNVVYYVFGHDPSPSGRIQCGVYAGNGSATGPIVTLGWTPRLLIIKNRNTTGDWIVIDVARGFTTGNDAYHIFNATTAQSTGQYVDPLTTGFQIKSILGNLNTSENNYLYIAFR